MRVILLLSISCLSYGMGEDHRQEAPAPVKCGIFSLLCGIKTTADERRPLLGNIQEQPAASPRIAATRNGSFCEDCRDKHGGKIAACGGCLCAACIIGVICSFADVGSPDIPPLIECCDQLLSRR